MSEEYFALPALPLVGLIAGTNKDQDQ